MQEKLINFKFLQLDWRPSVKQTASQLGRSHPRSKPTSLLPSCITLAKLLCSFPFLKWRPALPPRPTRDHWWCLPPMRAAGISFSGISSTHPHVLYCSRQGPSCCSLAVIFFPRLPSEALLYPFQVQTTCSSHITATPTDPNLAIPFKAKLKSKSSWALQNTTSSIKPSNSYKIRVSLPWLPPITWRIKKEKKMSCSLGLSQADSVGLRCDHSSSYGKDLLMLWDLTTLGEYFPCSTLYFLSHILIAYKLYLNCKLLENRISIWFIALRYPQKKWLKLHELPGWSAIRWMQR